MKNVNTVPYVQSDILRKIVPIIGGHFSAARGLRNIAARDAG